MDFKYVVVGARRPTPSAPPPPRAGLTHRLSVSVGFVAVPRYTSTIPSAPWPCGHRCVKYFVVVVVVVGARHPTLSAPPSPRAGLTHRLSVSVGFVAVPCYPSPCLCIKHLAAVIVEHRWSPESGRLVYLSISVSTVVLLFYYTANSHRYPTLRPC